MSELIHEEHPKARKNHNCMACDFLLANILDTLEYLSFSEKRSIVNARRNQWEIQKGEIYTKQFCLDGGVAYTFRAITAIHEICLEYDLYPE